MFNQGRPLWTQSLSETDLIFLERDLFTIDAASAYLQASTRWVYQAIKKGELEARVVSKRKLLKKSTLDRYLGLDASQNADVHKHTAFDAPSTS